MTRPLLPTLALVVALGACDSNAPAEPAAVAATSLADSKGLEAVHHVTDAVSVAVEGETVLLLIDGKPVPFEAGEAYVVGQILSRAGFEALPEKVAAGFPPPSGGDRCDPPPPGSAVRAVGGRFFGGDCPPPPPPPIFFERPDFQQRVLGESVEVVEAPKGLDWFEVPGGFATP